ncbi:hypothetical protein INS49_004446 [Diaporthe citri]|uniref:uncharacterized protein n=1 Tax=Diaporthe citri TaxID=83186 RepID=UPI001C7FECA5|nr:uncharacterized protein INS49_004446 [Diaporthe citri]KAG6354429.1 hypothetical protein INS49_004446 [Diaporthe citri]
MTSLLSLMIILVSNDNGTLWYDSEPNRYQLYTGEFDHGNSTPSCDKFQARDTAEHTALNQPFWDALYPAKEYKLVYTVQDGRLYLTWRVTFNLKDKVGDDWVVWVNALDCSQVVAVAPANMDHYMKSLEDFDNAQDQLFLDHGLSIVHETA